MFKSEKNALGDPLGPSWADLGPILERSELENRAPAHTGAVFSKFTFLTKIWLQDALWTELGPILVPKSSHMGPQEGPKRHQKRAQNDIKILIEIQEPGGCTFGPARRNALASWGDHRGV